MAVPSEDDGSDTGTAAQRLAEMTTLRDEADVHARELEALLAQVTDPMVVYDLQSQVVRCNGPFEALLAQFSNDASGVTLQDRADGLSLLDLQGETLVDAQSPQQRMMHGEVITDANPMQATIRSATGRQAIFSVTGGALYHAERITGAVVYFRDITRQKGWEAEALRANERFQLAERAANGFVFEWDVRTGVFYRSEGVTRMLGYAGDELPPTWEAWVALIHPDDVTLKAGAEALAYLEDQQEETLENEYRVRHRDGHYLTVAEHTLIQRDAAGQVMRLIGQIHDITQHKQMEDALRRARDELEQRVQERTHELGIANLTLRRLSQRILEAQEAERRYIAQELHDEIGQALTGVKMMLDTFDKDAHTRNDPGAGMEPEVTAMLSVDASRLAEVSATVSKTLEQVRDMSLDLRPAVLDSLGLAPALQWHFERYTRQTGIDVHFSAEGLDRRLSPYLEVGAYRLIQEALTNVARHAGVAEVTVQIVATETLLSLYVVDNGAGFDVEEALAAGVSAGLAGMRERASLLGGTLEIMSMPGEGTTIQADLPMPANTEVSGALAGAHSGRQAVERDAARDALRDSVRDAARDAARDDTRDLERDTTRDTARDTMRDTTRDAVRDSTRDISRDMTRDVPRDALRDVNRDVLRDLTRDAAHQRLVRPQAHERQENAASIDSAAIVEQDAPEAPEAPEAPGEHEEHEEQKP